MPIMKVFVFTVSYCGSSGRLYAFNEGFAVYSLLLLLSWASFPIHLHDTVPKSFGKFQNLQRSGYL